MISENSKKLIEKKLKDHFNQVINENGFTLKDLVSKEQLRTLMYSLGFAAENSPMDIKLLNDLIVVLIPPHINPSEEVNCLLIENIKRVVFAIMNIKQTSDV